MPYIESFLEFAQRMGSQPVATRQGHLFENGARSDGAWTHEEPPADEVVRLRRRIEFHNIRIVAMENRFRQIVSYIDTQTKWHEMGAGGPADPKAFTDLETAKRDIALTRERVGQLRERVESLVGPSPLSAYDAKRADERERVRRDRDRLRRLVSG